MAINDRRVPASGARSVTWIATHDARDGGLDPATATRVVSAPSVAGDGRRPGGRGRNCGAFDADYVVSDLLIF
jgi:hypothetical protein